ncbi:hypothetical protein ABZ816_36155 [Actinosynnema sp. NPDC047251]|nr:hypothetical protein [Saccharothrix espanaensis]
MVDQRLYERIVYGSGDDAVLSELFGLEVAVIAGTDGERGAATSSSSGC